MHIHIHSYKNRYYTFIHAYIIHIYISHCHRMPNPSMGSIRSYIIIHVYQLRCRFISLTELLHHCEELDYNFGWRFDQDLAFPTLLCVIHILERIIQHTDSHHVSGTPKKTKSRRRISKEVRDGDSPKMWWRQRWRFNDRRRQGRETLILKPNTE